MAIEIIEMTTVTVNDQDAALDFYVNVDVNPHDLRHCFGYRMAETVPLHRLVQTMGHDSLDTTRLYIQGTKQDLQQAVECRQVEVIVLLSR